MYYLCIIKDNISINNLKLSIMAKLNGHLVTIDGITYRMEMVDDKRDKVIISMNTKMGVLQTVCDRYKGDDEFPLNEGEYDLGGDKFSVEYVCSDDLKGRLGTPLSELDLEDMISLAIGL
jgi:hypothetical protein